MNKEDMEFVEWYQKLGLPYHAAHVEKFGLDAFGKYFTGPDKSKEGIMKKCVESGVPYCDMIKPPKPSSYI